MRKEKKKSAGVIILLIVLSLILGVIGNAVIDMVYTWIYPEKYHNLVRNYADKYSVPEELVFAIIKVESNFDPNVVSSAGAVGLMQILPSTYKWLNTKIGDDYWYESLYNPETNIKYGTYYLQYLYSRFGSWEKAIIAYNWGEGNFSDFLNNNGYTEGDYDSIPVEETRNYVKKVMHHWEKYKKLY